MHDSQMTGPIIEPHDNLAQLPSTDSLGDSLMNIEGMGNEVQLHGDDSRVTGRVIEQLPEPCDSLQQLLSKDRLGDESLEQPPQ